MSAIAGIVNLDGRPVERVWLEAMVERLAHRGHDDRGLWIKGTVGLGHRALWTTPEASLEALPMEVRGRAVITGDLRLDNREDLLGALSQSSRLTDAAGDGELAVAAYEKWGED